MLPAEDGCQTRRASWALCERVRRLLERHRVWYEVVPHQEAFTAQAAAQTSHVPGRSFAKVAVMRAQAGSDFMVVLPASQDVNSHLIRYLTGRSGVHLEGEMELRRLFTDCEVGAMPPFGELYGMSMYVDPCLSDEEDLYFQVGNHHEVVHMRYEDYEHIADPLRADVCLPRNLAVAGG